MKRIRGSTPKTIYAIRCRENGRVYIGCTQNVESRVRSHMSELSNGLKTCAVSKCKREKTHWQTDFDKYGQEAFEVYILQKDVPTDMSRDVEREHILKYRANEREYGYNIKLSGLPSPFTVMDGIPPLPSQPGEIIAAITAAKNQRQGSA